jgi:superfamily I DNA/RNA helicase
MSAWLIPQDRLTADQRRAVEMPVDAHCVIAGGTGSGKTQVILHRAKHLSSRFAVPPVRFRIVVFTSTLRRSLASACPLLDIPPECITTFRDFCVEYYRTRIDEKIPWVSYGIGTLSRPDFWGTRPDVERHASRSLGPAYDFLLVDEGQDLDINAFYLFRALAHHITATVDHCQQIYPNRASEREILCSLGLRERSMTLPGCLRCNPHVVNLAAALIEDPANRQAFLSHVRTVPQDRETPVIYFAPPFSYTPHLAQTIRDRQLAGDRVGVIVPTQKCIRPVARNLRGEGVDIETGEDRDFASMKPKLFTYHGCKGLTFDTVCLPFLEDIDLWDPLIDDLRRFLFLAITRATRWVYISSKFYNPLPIIESLLPLEKEGVISIRDYRSENPKEKSEPKNENPLDFL